MEIQKEKADKRRLQAKQAREAKFNAFFDTIVAERYAEVATQADAYLFEEIDGKRAFKMFVDEMTAALFIKEKIDETVERWQSGFHWKLEYEWELLARSFVHKDTGERVYHRKEAGVPKSSRATKDKMKQIARDNFVGRKEFESSKMVRPGSVSSLLPFQPLRCGTMCSLACVCASKHTCTHRCATVVVVLYRAVVVACSTSSRNGAPRSLRWSTNRCRPS